MSESTLYLKWGSYKGFYGKLNDQTLSLLNKYFEYSVNISAILQKDTLEQQKLLLDAIDAHDGKIVNDWSGEEMTKEQAKEYIVNYR